MQFDSRAKLVILSFTDDKAGELEIDVEGTTYVYNFAQYTASWGLNEIPTAEVVVAVGTALNGPATGSLATIHASASKLRRLYRARIYEKAEGDWDATGTKWPESRLKVFEGFFEGYGHRTSEDGKVAVIIFLRHWLMQLTCSSAISAISHAGNPWQFSAKSLAVAAGGTVANNEYGLVGHLPLSAIVAAKATGDLWGAIKEMFSRIAGTSTVSVNITGKCLTFSTDNPTKNDVALEALKRIEGPGKDTALAYQFGAPLKVDPNFNAALLSISDTISAMTIRGLANFTIWDKLVGEVLPMFGMALVPMVDRAIVIACNPLYNGGIWRTIPTGDYESGDVTKRFSYPLRGVAVYGMMTSYTGVGAENKIQSPILTGGCFIAPTIKPGEGVYQFVPAPPWLTNYAHTVNGRNFADQIRAGEAGPSTTGKNQANTNPPPSPVDITNAYNRYAQFVYVANNLAESVGNYGTKHRFDIAPGSLVKINGRRQGFGDTLAADEYGMVARVTIFAGAEGPQIGTSIMLSNMRSETDYTDIRFGVSEHPLFTKDSIHGAGKHGAPLLAEFKDLS